ncbi:MAG TPA: hypothetical protein VK361_00155 [Rubrobacteraceae bacterium]|nr:hypothetical protein [Rubrobacteraceae bacterium]
MSASVPFDVGKNPKALRIRRHLGLLPRQDQWPLDPGVVAGLFPDLSPEEVEEMAEAKEAAFRKRAGELEPLSSLSDFIAKGQKEGMRIALVTSAPKENVLLFWML